MPSQDNEFSADAHKPFDLKEMTTLSRRRFLALTSATSALALAGCGNFRDEGKAVPYAKQAEEILPGEANYYATTLQNRGQSYGVLVKTREGRPIHLDGNPLHPNNQKSLPVQVQAELMALYDPERLKSPTLKSKVISWKKSDSLIRNAFEKSKKENKEIVWILPAVISPSIKSLIQIVQKKYPTARILSTEMLDEGVTPQNAFDLSKARCILSLDYDFLGTDGLVQKQTRNFAKTRDAFYAKEVSKLYVVEGGMSLTGMNADVRFRIRPSEQLYFVLALLNELILVQQKIGNAQDQKVRAILAPFTIEKIAQIYKLKAKTLRKLARDLVNNKGQSFVLAGSHLQENVQVAVQFLNELLKNRENLRKEKHRLLMPLCGASERKQLLQSAQSNQIGMVIVTEANPVYTWAKDSEITKIIQSADLSVCFDTHKSETGHYCKLCLPSHHALESWGDAWDHSSVFSLQQPAIAPLYNSRQWEGAILSWVQDRSYSEVLWKNFVQKQYVENIYPLTGNILSGKQSWNAALHDGVVFIDNDLNDLNAEKETIQSFSAIQPKDIKNANIELRIKAGLSLGDGRLANVGWLQELPHPVSKVTWGNYAALSLATAKKYGIRTEYSAGNVEYDLIEVKVQNRALRLPALVIPGFADNFIEIECGFGRHAVGSVGKEIGANALSLLSDQNTDSKKGVFSQVLLTRAVGTQSLAITQEHHSLNPTNQSFGVLEKEIHNIHLKRGIVREGTYQQFKKNPSFLKSKTHHDFSVMNRPHQYSGVKWAMAIDLSKCTGCSQCVMSCNSENNIPVVGKEQVLLGREMQWIRIDRYWAGSEEEPRASQQPMLCSHCDNAPCENVCPVVATTHSAEGLNEMTYNRCVGTRYCANNCPTKVRRFNFFDFRRFYNQGFQKRNPQKLLENPEVTIRSRGVMEKCTFCVQKINEARAKAKTNGEKWNGQNVKTACQNACPSDAIVFGNVNDLNSEISKLAKTSLQYTVLENMGIASNIHYLAKLRNIDSEDVKL